MRFKPVNPNPTWPNEHALFLGASGSGKSQMCGHLCRQLPKDARVIIWDQSGDHSGAHFESKAGFIKGLRRGVESGKGFRVAFSGAANVANFEWWCEVAWSLLDGNRRTYLIAEELSQVCQTSAKASPNAAVLLNQSRKYGGVFYGLSQKPQEVSKTFFDQCEHKYIGAQRGLAMARRMAEEIGVDVDKIRRLESLNFYYSDGSFKEPELIKIKYKKPVGVKWYK